jgi:hypothetical protein
MMDYSPSDYVFLVDRTNYTFRRSDLLMDRNRTSAVWLDWAIRDNNTISGDILSCADAAKTTTTTEYACVSDHTASALTPPMGLATTAAAPMATRETPTLSTDARVRITTPF